MLPCQYFHVSQHHCSPCLLSRTIFRNLDTDAGFRATADVGGDGDNDSDPVLLAEVGGDGDNDSDPGFLITTVAGEDDESEPRDSADINVECASDIDLFNLPCVGGAGEMLSASERGGDVTGGLLSLSGEYFPDIVFGEDELRTKFLGLAGRRGGDE